MELRVKKKIVQRPEEVVEIFRSIQKAEHEMDRMKEKFYVVGLNVRKRIVYIELVAMGTLTACLVQAREVYRFAIIRAVSEILVLHSHPSGDPEPSDDDLAITKRLHEAGKILGIELLDHIIVTHGPAFFSFKAEGRL
ncbi:MAG: JAB domain-containing protein [Syntrophorhabdales bacterium]|jgi:DNA repair protein RadC